MTEQLLSNNKKIIYNTGALYIRMFVTMVISFFTARITLNILGIDNYGLNNLVGGIVSLFSFINLSIGTSVQRFYSIEIGKQSRNGLTKVFGTGMYLHLIIAGITLVIAEICAIFLLNRLNIPPERMFAAHFVFQISIVSLILQILNVPYAALLRAREEFSRMAIIEVFQAFLRLIVLFFLSKINYDKLIVFSFLNFCVTIFYVISLVLLSRKYEETRFQFKEDKILMKEMLMFSFMMMLAVFAQLFRDQGILVLINLFFGLTINAAYAVALQIANIVDSFTLSFKQSIVPQLMSSFGENNKGRMNSLIFTGTKIMFSLLLMVTLPVIFESEYILNLWFVHPPEYSAQFTTLLLTNIIIYSFSYFLTQGIHASGKIKRLQIYSSIILLVNIGLIYLALKLGCNFYSIVYITMGISIFINIINIASAKRSFDLDVKYFLIYIMGKSLIVCACVSSILYIIISSLNPSFSRLVITTSVSFISIAGLSYYIGLDKLEKELAAKSIVSLKHRIWRINS